MGERVIIGLPSLDLNQEKEGRQGLKSQKIGIFIKRL
jgi:hypothetical protein